jgi:hypothetical protein
MKSIKLNANSLTNERLWTKEELCPELKISQLEDPSMAKELLQKKDVIYLEKAKAPEIRIYVTLRIRGLEKILKASGPLAFVLFVLSNMSDISDAEFTFTELQLLNEQMDR